MTERLALLVATCGGVGYAPVVPGTFGSLAGLALFALLRLGGPTVEVAVIVLLFAAGVWSATIAERRLGHDPAPAVIDEVVGMLVTLALLPVTVPGLLVGFLLFRVLDILKPWPAGRFERLPAGLGVMCDDVMAGIYGNVLLRATMVFAPGWLA